ncbi:MAG: hypothetical protein K1X72_11165 [Pyrinomonadaceae bacterium]|nr:hypothetical protein [Pyrinomonadaceae bacterium]
MKYWNYRVVKDTGNYSIYSVYYDEQDRVIGCSENPEPAISEDLESLRTQLKLMIEATTKPVIDLEQVNKEKKL